MLNGIFVYPKVVIILKHAHGPTRITNLSWNNFWNCLKGEKNIKNELIYVMDSENCETVNN